MGALKAFDSTIVASGLGGREEGTVVLLHDENGDGAPPDRDYVRRDAITCSFCTVQGVTPSAQNIAAVGRDDDRLDHNLPGCTALGFERSG